MTATSFVFGLSIKVPRFPTVPLTQRRRNSIFIWLLFSSYSPRIIMFLQDFSCFNIYRWQQVKPGKFELFSMSRDSPVVSRSRITGVWSDRASWSLQSDPSVGWGSTHLVVREARQPIGPGERLLGTLSVHRDDCGTSLVLGRLCAAFITNCHWLVELRIAQVSEPKCLPVCQLYNT